AHHRRIAPSAERFWSWSSPSGSRRAQRRAELFMSLGDLARGKRALEIGCGTGVFLEKVAVAGATIVGVDLSAELLAQAGEKVQRLKDVYLSRGNAEELPYPQETFDAVYGSSVLHHLHLGRAIREVFRVLRPGGRAVFAEPNLLNPQVAFMFHFAPTKGYFGVSPDEMAFSRFRAASALRDAGFAQVSVVPFDFLHPSVPEGSIDFVARVGRGLERIPLLREVAGSLLIQGTKR
ncbi:MAG TPA: class I SAM-dependent methyltransferase, partial [Vicinamibacteria bacterium]|nr:class I SAM-dependent methyltransferase [Vicinamibacteria bacterium]